MTDPLEDVVSLGARLRAAGVAADTTRLTAFAQALETLGYADAYWAGRATLVRAADEIPAFDKAFAEHFGDRGGDDEQSAGRTSAAEGGSAVASGGEDESAEQEEIGSDAAHAERLRSKRFDLCSEDELEEVGALLHDLLATLARRRSRRYRRNRRGRLDPRRTLRRALRDGDLKELQRRQRLRPTRRLVLLIDVSGSMSAFTRVLLAFAHAAGATDPRYETFCFGTRLTRVTDQLRAGQVDAAIAAASARVSDWDGGTRIGETLDALLDEWGAGTALRGSVIVICSDGLDTGEPSLLAEQMERLARTSHRIAWLNPLMSLEGYRPLARGMSAALPFVDRFAAGDTLASLEDTAQALTAMTARRGS